jgi:multiple sugar transport system ATP-binding protein
MNLIKVRVLDDCTLRNGDIIVSPDERQQKLLKQYVGDVIILGIRPESIIPGDEMNLTVRMNENLGQFTLIDGNLGKKRVMCKFKGWYDFDSGDEIKVGFDRNKIHFFDVETNQAIRG